MRHVPAKLFSELTACPYMDCHLIEKGGVRVEVRPYIWTMGYLLDCHSVGKYGVRVEVWMNWL